MDFGNPDGPQSKFVSQNEYNIIPEAINTETPSSSYSGLLLFIFTDVRFIMFPAYILHACLPANLTISIVFLLFPLPRRNEVFFFFWNFKISNRCRNLCSVFFFFLLRESNNGFPFVYGRRLHRVFWRYSHTCLPILLPRFSFLRICGYAEKDFRFRH